MQYDYDSKDILRLLDEKRDFETMGQLFDTLKAALDRALQRENALLDGGVACRRACSSATEGVSKGPI